MGKVLVGILILVGGYFLANLATAYTAVLPPLNPMHWADSTMPEADQAWQVRGSTATLAFRREGRVLRYHLFGDVDRDLREAITATLSRSSLSAHRLETCPFLTVGEIIWRCYHVDMRKQDSRGVIRAYVRLQGSTFFTFLFTGTAVDFDRHADKVHRIIRLARLEWDPI